MYEKISTEGRIELLESVFSYLINAGYIWVAVLILGTVIIGHYALKIFTVIMICKNPNLSDKKVDSITQMISKKLFKF